MLLLVYVCFRTGHPRGSLVNLSRDTVCVMRPRTNEPPSNNNYSDGGGSLSRVEGVQFVLLRGKIDIPADSLLRGMWW